MANAISRDIGTSNGRFVLFNNLLKLITLITGKPTKTTCVCITFHVFMFVVRYFMYFLLYSYAVNVIGLLAVASAH